MNNEEYNELGMRKDIRRDILILAKGLLEHVEKSPSPEWGHYPSDVSWDRYLRESKYLRIEQYIYFRRSRNHYGAFMLLVYVSFGSNRHYELFSKEFSSADEAKEAMETTLNKIKEMEIEKDDSDEEKRGYKVLSTGLKGTKIRGPGMSIYAPPTGSVMYQVGRPTRPLEDCGPLTAFGTLKDAKKFTKFISTGGDGKLAERIYKGLQVWKCSYKPSKTDILYCKTFKEDQPRYFRFEYPEGTIFAREITLLEEVK